MVLDSRVVQASAGIPCPSTPGSIKLRAEVLAVTLDEGELWAWPVATASGSARLSANIPTIRLLFFAFFMFPFLLEPMWLYRDRAESVLALGFSGFSTVRFFPPPASWRTRAKTGKRLFVVRTSGCRSHPSLEDLRNSNSYEC